MGWECLAVSILSCAVCVVVRFATGAVVGVVVVGVVAGVVVVVEAVAGVVAGALVVVDLTVAVSRGHPVVCCACASWRLLCSRCRHRSLSFRSESPRGVRLVPVPSSLHPAHHPVSLHGV